MAAVAEAAAAARRLSGIFSSSTSKPGNPNPSSDSRAWVRSLARSLFLERDLDKLAAGFVAACSHRRFRCYRNAYHFTIVRLAQFGRTDAVVAVLEAQKRFPSEFAREGFSARIISLYGKVGLPERAAATFNELPGLGYPRTVLSFNALLSAYSDAGEFPTVHTLFKEIPACDPSVMPNLYSYNILLGASAKKGDLDAALDILSTMEKNGIAPNLVTYITLMNGLYQSGQIIDGDKVWDLVTEKGFKPTSICFTSKIKALISADRMEEAIEMISSMEQHGPKPDIRTYNAIIRGYCNVGKLEEAKKLCHALVKDGCAPNRRTYQMLVPSLVKVGELDHALNYCTEGLNRGCWIDYGVLLPLVDALVKVSRTGEAKNLEELAAKNI